MSVLRRPFGGMTMTGEHAKSREAEVPVYIQCPVCEHPAVLPPAFRGRPHRCRQCNRVYIVPAPPAPVAEERSPDMPGAR